MDRPENQADIDQAEWENPDNWAGFWFRVYFSKRDSRLWVPKRAGVLSGKTINFGHRWGSTTVALITYLFVGIATIVMWMAAHKK